MTQSVSSAADRRPADGARRVGLTRMGAAIGSSSFGAIGWAARWSGLTDASWYVWVLAAALGALLGALTWRVFAPGPEGLERPGIGFAALYGACVGMLVGAFVAFPVGGSIGALGGAVGGATIAVATRFIARVLELDGWVRLGVAWVHGAAFALLASLWATS